MIIITLLWWSLGHGNLVVPSRWQATIRSSGPGMRDACTPSPRSLPHLHPLARELDRTHPGIAASLPEAASDQAEVREGR